MLSRLDLRHFKCFEVLHMPLAPLTLLAGLNASGKSSILQALVLIHQTMREHEWSTRLMLNGDAVRLGTVSDVVDKVFGRQSFEIGVLDDERVYGWTFVGERSEMSMAVDQLVIGNDTYAQPPMLRYLFPPEVNAGTISVAKRLRSLTYITAERVGPREVYSLEDRQSAMVVGPQGEHAVSVLQWGRDEHVIDGLAIPDVSTTRLRQVEERMRTFFPNFTMLLQQIPYANAVTLGLRTSDDTDFHRPIHAGFGLTQVFPIVVAALSAAKGDILLVENPEVHLHPEGQSLMGQFLSDVARSGVQVIVETHSDHVLNGIRRAVKANRLLPEQVAIHFFTKRIAGLAQVVSPQLDGFGNIDHWPEGFFDQTDKDASYFAGWGG